MWHLAVVLLQVDMYLAAAMLLERWRFPIPVDNVHSNIDDAFHLRQHRKATVLTVLPEPKQSRSCFVLLGKHPLAPPAESALHMKESRRQSAHHNFICGSATTFQSRNPKMEGQKRPANINASTTAMSSKHNRSLAGP